MNPLRHTMAVMCLLFSYTLFSQPIFINEFLASNSTVNVDAFGENDDWVELYNASSTPVDVGGWYATDDLDEPTKWQIPNTDPTITTVPAGGFLLLWFDKDLTQGPLHIDAKLSADGEDIGLFGPDGTTQIDALSFGPQSADISFGRTTDGGQDWQFFLSPTPNVSNEDASGSDFAAAPVASVGGGFFQNDFTVDLTTTTPNAEIRFTLDGSEPTANSTLFDNSLEVTSTTTLRARAFATGFQPSKVTTHTYLLEDEHEFPVVALSFEDADFFDPATGIYPNYTEDWERPVNVEFFEPDGSLAFGQKATVEIHGTGSASLPQKSLKLKAIADGGSGFFEHEIFPDLPFEKHPRFLLRNSGQDFNVTQFRDGMVASLTADLTDVGGIIEPPQLFQQGFRPAVLYLNGEFWGIQNLREHLTGSYLEQHFNLDLNNVDLLDNDNEAKEGDFDQWDDLQSFLQNNTFFSDDQMAQLSSIVDMPHYLDYQAYNIIIDNGDWPGNNYRRWKERNGESKWRFLSYDLDFTFGLFTHVPGGAPLWNQGEASANSLARSLDDSSFSWPAPLWTTLLFRRTMENPTFRTDFANRSADFLNVLFESERVNKRIDEFKNNYQNEIVRHFDRWTQYVSVWNNNIDLLHKFADERPAYVREHFVEEMAEITGTASLSLEANPAQGGSIKISTLDLSTDVLPWNGIYFTGIDIPLEAVAAPGYVFVGWSEVNLGGAATKLNLDGDLVLVANFQLDGGGGGPIAQSIDFPSIPPKLTTDAPFQISATASSGLPVDLEIISGPATISGTEISLTGEVGTVLVRATQAGNADWQPASPVVRQFSVSEPVVVSGDYCEVFISFPWHEWIERVQFGGIDHVSFKSQYGDFTDVSTVVPIGSTLPLTITPAFSWEVWDEYFRAWIDYNHDGDFDDPGELVLEKIGIAAVTQEVTIPANVIPGTTRMRVSMRREQVADPCENFTFGEVEDYSIILSADEPLSPSNDAVENYHVNIYPNPVDERLSVRFSTKESGVVGFTIVSPLGVNVYQEKMRLQDGEHYVEMDVSQFKSGTYTLFIDSEGLKRRAVRFVRVKE